MKRNSQARTTAYFVFAVIASALLIQGSAFPVVAAARGGAQAALLPLQVLSAQLVAAVEGAAGTIGQIGSLKAENQRLQDQVDELQARIDQMSVAQQREQALQDALQFKQQHDFALQPAEVVGFDPEGLLRQIVIDKGGRDGIRTGMVVASGRGLVGRVMEVGPASSRVQLLLDGDARVNAVTLGSQVNGTVAGTGDKLVFQLQPGTADQLKMGDQLVTSGLGGTFPAGIAVGTVSSYQKIDYEIVQSALIQPAVDFSRLQVVLVITNFQPLR